MSTNPEELLTLEKVLEFVDALVHAKQGKQLSSLQVALLRAAWSTQRQGYRAIAQAHGYSENYLKYDAGPKLWHLLSEIFHEKVHKTNFRAALERQWRAAVRQESQDVADWGNRCDEGMRVGGDDLLHAPHSTPYVDWGEAVDVSVFYGRTEDLTLLQHWIANDRCRLVALIGIGGIGKTSLSVKLAQQLIGTREQNQILAPFEYVIWRSLRDAPPLNILLDDLLQFYTQESDGFASDGDPSRLSRLIHCFKQRRYLVILDNFETILRSSAGTVSDRVGQYLDAYEDYGEFLLRVGETTHLSCLIITSREKPREIARLEGISLPVRSRQLSGLGWVEGQAIFNTKGLFAGSEQDWQDLIQRYSGNPLALKVISTSIQELFDENIGNFLEQGTTIFGDICDLLNQQFSRLSELETEIIYWLAINREPISLSQLRADVVSPLPQQAVMEALESLRRRSLIERATSTLIEKKSTLFALQPVVTEYVTAQLIARSYQEIINQNLKLLQSHALIEAQAKDYVRETQIRLILQPLVHQLLGSFQNRYQLEAHLQDILSKLKRATSLQPGYAAGNLLNLFCHLQTDLTGYDFSNLTVWQAYLQGISLQRVNFTGADLSKSVFTKPLGGALSVAFSPDGQYLATSDNNGTIRLWHVADGKQRLTCEGYGSWVCLVAFSPDGQFLASAGEDHTVKLWSTTTGACLHTFAGHSSWVWSVAFSPDGHFLASASEDQTIRLWSLRTDRCLKLMGHNSWVCSVAFSPKGNLLASAADDHLLRLWNVRTGECLKNFWGHTDRVSSIAFSPDGQTIASASEDQTIKLWNVKTGECLRSLKGHKHWVWSVAFSSDGKTLISGSQDQTVKVWDVASGQCLKTLQGHTSWVQSVAFSPDGITLASGSEDQTVRLWNARTGQCLSTLQGYAGWVQSVAFSPDGNTLASSSEDHTARLWNVASGQCLKMLYGPTSALLFVAFSPDGQLLAGGGFDQTVRLWQVETGECVAILRGHGSWIRSVAFSPDGQTLLSSGGDCHLKLWNVQTGECLKTLRGHPNWVWSVKFSPSGTRLASCGDDRTIRLWDTQSGECLKILRDHTSGVTSVAFSPDGKHLASSSADQTIKLWDLEMGECLCTFTGHDSSVFLVTFSFDGSLLASSSADRTIKLWQVSTGECLRTLYGHKNLVFAVDFSPNRQILASGSRDETIKIWRINDGTCWKTLRAERPYEQMNITGAIGLTEAQKTTLHVLGAVDNIAAP